MRNPTIADARAICDRLNARAVIVIALSDDNVCGASYGETRVECRQTAQTMDLIIREIEAGNIPVWGQQG